MAKMGSNDIKKVQTTSQATDSGKAQATGPEKKAAHKQPWWRRLLSGLGKVLIPLTVSVGLCVVMFRDIDFGEMMNVIKTQCDFHWIALMLAISILPMVLRGLRWGIQLRGLGIKVPAGALILSIFGTYAVNLVFPRLGEVWRSGYISLRQKAPFSEVFGSMIGDRFADLLTVGLLTVMTFFIARGPIVDFVRTYPQAYEAILKALTSPWLWGSVAAVCLAFWLFVTRSKSRIAAKIKSFVKGLWEGFVVLVKMPDKGKWLLLTVLIWGCYFYQLVVAFNAFPMTREIMEQAGLTAPLVCFILTSISMGIPSNGGIGPYQTTMLFGLALFAPAEIPTQEFRTIGAAFGNVIIATQTALMIVLGLFTFVMIAWDRTRKKKLA